MPLTPNELLEVLDNAIGDVPWFLPTAPALDLTQRVVCGERGRIVNEREVDFEGAAPIFSFTRSQCKRMRKHILSIAGEAVRVPRLTTDPDEPGR
jgi:hypothetical protein